MKKGIGFLFCVLAAIGCSKNSDDNNSGGGGGWNQKSVIGQSSKIGVFPDGTQAQPLNAQQMDQVSKTAEGVMKVNQALNGVAPQSSQTTGDVRVEAVQAFMRSPFTRSVMNLRAGVTDADQFKQILQGSCQIQQGQSQPVQNNSGGHFEVSQKSWSTIQGTGCPLESRTDMDSHTVGDSTGDKSAHVVTSADFSTVTSMVQQDQATAFDFVRQSIGGRIDSEGNFSEQAIEMIENGTLKAQLDTKTQGQINGQILFDMHVTASNQQSSSNPQPVSNGSMTLAMAVVMDTQAGKILLQMFLSGSGQNSVAKVYLNGKELQGLSQQH